MSETRAGGGGRYQRSTGGFVGAMIVTVLIVLAYAGFRSLTRDNEPTPVRSVDYATAVKGGRADGKLLVLAPATLPAGWTATSADYLTGSDPTWHLGLLTSTGKYVGLEESQASVESLVEQHVDADATRGRDVTIDGQTWQSFTDRGGDYAVARTLERDGRRVESWLVVGTAPEDQVRALAASLEGASGPVGD